MTTYRWVHDWVELPQEPLGWMHSGIAFMSGEIVVAHPGQPALLFYDSAGTLLRQIALDGLLEPHGFRVVDDGIWIGDVGFKRQVRGSTFETESALGRLVMVDMQGKILKELGDPRSGWSPTCVSVVEETGDVWVADGYGESLVHRFDAKGQHIQTLTGEEGGGRFDCPHGVLVDRRRADPEVYISDRANGRIQVYDLGGRFQRVVGAGIVVTPTDMAVNGTELVLTDFTQARVTVLDINDRLVQHIGSNPLVRERDGWPNARDAAGNLVRPPLEPGKFNSPHTLIADPDGNVFVTEWLIGGRLSKLELV